MGLYTLFLNAVERGGPDSSPVRELFLGQQRSLPNPLDLGTYFDHLLIICALLSDHK